MPYFQIQAANVLFVDNPVGTGYSYVDNKKYLTRNVQEISKDLVSVMKAFVIKHSIFEVNSSCLYYLFGT